MALVAMDARLDLLGPRGSRSLPVAALHRLPGDAPQQETVLEALDRVVGQAVALAIAEWELVAVVSLAGEVSCQATVEILGF